MAYMSQERKASIAPVVKEILKRYKVKGSLSVRNHSTLVLNIKSGPIDFINNFNNTCGTRVNNPAKDSISINPYWYHEHFSGQALQCLDELVRAMNVGNHDNSDIMTDYFDVGWYIDVNIGQWNKPYTVEV